MKTLAVALLASLTLASVGRAGTGHDKPPETARFVLGINQDKSLTLDGKAVTRNQSVKEWPLLAERVREKAKAAGEALDPKQILPAVIMIWAADETPYSFVSALMLEAQESGFRKWAFVPKSLLPDPSMILPVARLTKRAEPDDLPDLLRTIPIRLRADDQGKIDRVTLGEIALQDFKALRLELSKIHDDPDAPFDRAFLKIDSALIFSELVRVTDSLKMYGITVIDFIEIRPEDDQ